MKRYILPLMLSAMAIAAISCSSNSTVNNPEETPSTESPVASSPSSDIQTPLPTTTPSPASKTAPFSTQTPSTPSPSPDKPNQKKAANSKKVDITVFTSDVQCQEHVAKKVTVSANKPVTDAVGEILAERDTGDFNISNYRVNIDKGVATVDLRVSPNSQRQITSLSSCEQFALFGSLRKTLTSNPKWKIKDVRFTEAGEEIIL